MKMSIMAAWKSGQHHLSQIKLFSVVGMGRETKRRIKALVFLLHSLLYSSFADHDSIIETQQTRHKA